MDKRDGLPFYESPVRNRLLAILSWTGVSQTELARRLGQNGDWVSRRVRGEGAIRADEVELLAEALRVDPCVFVSDEALAQLIGSDPRPKTPARTREVAADWAKHGVVIGDDSLSMLTEFITWYKNRMKDAER